MRRLAALFLLFSLLAGCAHAPFREPEEASYEAVEPGGMLEQFGRRLPDAFQMLNSVVFEYSVNSFMAIGFVDLDRKGQTFRVACLNPMGVQLFELSGDRSGIVTHNVLPVLLEYGDLPTAVGNDIRRIYFDQIPSAGADVIRGRHNIRFRQSHESGVMEFEFAGRGHDLVRKTYLEDGRPVWRVSYYEYMEQNGKRYPQGIVMRHLKYGYRLVVRQKELYS